MSKSLELLCTPPTGEQDTHIVHTDELVTLDKIPYEGDLPLVNYGISQEALQQFPDISPPRANTYVLNIKQISIDWNGISLSTNYTTMRSQFALRRWLPLLQLGSEDRKKILQHVLPIGGAMILETCDEKILMEERGKAEMPGKYNPAPAGGCETRDWQVVPELFRSIKGETWEETGLLPGQDYDTDIKIIGLVRDQTEAYNPTVTYYAKTHLTFDEVTKKADCIAPEAEEHQRLFNTTVNPLELLFFCSSQEEKIIGNGIGNLLVFGYFRHGASWLAQAREKLEKKNWNIMQHVKQFP